MNTLKSKKVVSTADLTQPHGGKLVEIKKTKHPKFLKAVYCGKQVKFPLFFGFVLVDS